MVLGTNAQPMVAESHKGEKGWSDPWMTVRGAGFCGRTTSVNFAFSAAI